MFLGKQYPSATYAEVVADDHNMLVEVQWPRQKRAFLEYLQRESSAIEQAVRYHLSLSSRALCTVAPLREWRGGSFNMMIPVTVRPQGNKHHHDTDGGYRVAVRCPWPHRMQSQTSPDMAAEKVRGEAATYAWLSAHVPSVPIPQLRGFGLSDGRAFTPLVCCSWIRRAYESLRQRLQRLFLFFSASASASSSSAAAEYWRPFFPSMGPVQLQTGYFITDFVERRQGRMLHELWPPREPADRQKMFRSLSRLLLDLIEIPLPRIGSFTVHDSGEVTLSGRPLTVPLAMLENEAIPSEIPPNTTYTCVETYLEDLLHCHDTRMEHQLNAVEGFYDAEGQLGTIVAWKAIRSHFMDRSLRNGPFALQLTDLHQSNIFVDDQYNITAIIDLEWTCSLPLEMLQPPFWLSGHIQDSFVGPSEKVITNEKAFIPASREFLDIFGEEQKSRNPSRKLPFNAESVIRAAFEKKSHWYFAGLKYPRVTYSFLTLHIIPIFAPVDLFPRHVYEFDPIFARYYTADASQFVDKKVKEKKQYDEALLELFPEEKKKAEAKKAEEKKAEEEKAKEEKAEEGKAEEGKAEEGKAEEKSVEEKTAEGKSVEEETAAEKTSEENNIEENNIEEKNAGEKNVEEKNAGEKNTEEKNAGKNAEEKNVEEKKAEEKNAE